MDDALQEAYRRVFQAVAALVHEPWRKIWWRTLMSGDPLHYYYYLPRTSSTPVYWEDADRRTGLSADERIAEIERAAAAVRDLWRVWTETQRGRASWTIATLVLTPDGVIHATYDHRHRHQIDPVEDQFAWEADVFGRDNVPYRLAALRRAVRSAWRRRRRRNCWQSTDTGYWECLPGVEAVYRGTRRSRLPAPMLSVAEPTQEPMQEQTGENTEIEGGRQ